MGQVWIGESVDRCIRDGRKRRISLNKAASPQNSFSRCRKRPSEMPHRGMDKGILFVGYYYLGALQVEGMGGVGLGHCF